MSKNRFIVIFGLLGLVWGASFIAIAVAVEKFPPWFSAALRLGLASVALAVIVKANRQNLKIPLDFAFRVYPMGLFMVGFPFALLFWGENYISPGLAGVLNGTVPIWTTLLSILFTSPRTKLPSWPVFLGLSLGFLGVLTIFFPDIQLRPNMEQTFGSLAVLTMAFSYGIANVATHRVLNRWKDIPINVSVFHQHFASFLFLFLMSLSFEKTPSVSEILAEPKALACLIYLAVVPSAIAFIFYLRLLKEAGAVRAGAVSYLIPVAALFFDLVIFNHIPGIHEMIGVILILSGLRLIRSEAK